MGNPGRSEINHMTLRAGKYDASRPRWRAVLRNDGYPWYVCRHDHPDKDSAGACARRALPLVRAADPENKGLKTAELPEGWHVYAREFDSGL